MKHTHLGTIPLAGAAVVLIALAGCSGQPSTEETSSGDGARGSFSLSYSVANTVESPYETMAKAYMQENPGVTITLNPQPFDRYGETLRTQVQSGNASDVVQTTPGRGQPQSAVALAEANFLLPLDMVPAGADADLLGLDGDFYALPVDLSATGTVFASATADGLGVDAPADTDELLRACASATDEGASFFALAGSVPSNTGLMALSISATRVYSADPDWNAQRASGDVTFADTEGWRNTLQTVIDLNEGGCFQPGAEGGGFDAITGGLAQGTSLAAFIPGSSDLPRSAPDAGIEVRAFPVADDEDPFLFVGPISALSITSTAADPDAATAFLEWMAEPAQSERFAELSGTLPASGLADADLSEGMYAPVADLIAEGAYIPLPRSGWPNAQVYEQLSVGTQGLITGQRTVDEVLAALDTAWG